MRLYIGIVAALLLIIFCFIPWAYYPDLQENFTGFYSSQNNYGKPGKAFIFLSVLSIVFFLIPKVWAKMGQPVYGYIDFRLCIKNLYSFFLLL